MSILIDHPETKKWWGITKIKVWVISGLLMLLLATAIGGCGGKQTEQGPTDTPTVSGTQGPSNSSERQPTATPQILGTQQSAEEKVEMPSRANLADLIVKYPELAALAKNLNLSDPKQVNELFDRMLLIYENEGTEGLHRFLVGTKLLRALNLDPAYLDFILAYESGGVEAAQELAHKRGLINAQDELRLILILDTKDSSVIEKQLQDLGGRIISQRGEKVEIGLPLEKLLALNDARKTLYILLQLAQSPHVLRIRVPVNLVPNGHIQAQGPTIVGAVAWHKAGYTGKGIRIGIIDPGGFGGYLQRLGKELPNKEHVFLVGDYDANFLNDETDPHGTACAEIIHAMAPDADIYLGYEETTLGFELAVDEMISKGVNIISHSGSVLGDATDGTSPEVLVTKHAADNGVLWVNSSGNYALTHIYMPFTDKDGDGWHEFPSGDELLGFTTPDAALTVALTWDDVWGGSEQNYDLYLYVPKGNKKYTVVASSRELQDGDTYDYPSEFFNYTFEEGQRYYLAIEAVDTTKKGYLNLLASDGEFGSSMPKGSLGTPGDSPSALTVGATYWEDDSLESYSSQGPTLDGRPKPDLVAPAGVSTRSYGQFYGTSASTPHVAGAAALVWSAFSNANMEQVRQYLLDNALDLGESGPEEKYGYGRLALPDPPIKGKEELPPSGEATQAPSGDNGGETGQQLEGIPENKTLIFGPRSGRLNHVTNEVSEYTVETNNIRDFVLEAEFVNPYDADTGSWDYGLFFRQDGVDRQFRLIIASDKSWGLNNNDGDASNPEWLGDGGIYNLDVSERGINRLTLVVNGKKGILYINDELIAHLDLSSRMAAGKITLATNIYSGDGIEGEVTRFKNLNVWSIP